jgi:hypothetical protein
VREEIVNTNIIIKDMRRAEETLSQAVNVGQGGVDAVCNLKLDTTRQMTELREQRELHNGPITAGIGGLLAAAAAAVMMSCAPSCGIGQFFAVSTLCAFSFAFLSASAAIAAY